MQLLMKKRFTREKIMKIEKYTSGYFTVHSAVDLIRPGRAEC